MPGLWHPGGVPRAVETRLRRWRTDDAPTVATMVDDPHIRRWSSMNGDPAGWIERQRAELRGPSRAICLTEDDRALGKMALRLPGHASPATSCAAVRSDDHPVGELSYWLVPEARGRGLAVGAVRQMMELVAATTDLRSVVLDIEDTNLASLRVAERLGAERRAPARVELDRAGVPRTLIAFVLMVARDG